MEQDSKGEKRNKINICFLGLFFSEDTLEEAKERSKAGVQMAAHVFQSNLLKGFEQRDDVQLSVIHVPPVGSYPINYNRLLFRHDTWKPGYVQIGYWNIPKIKHSIQEKKIESLLRRTLEPDRMNYLVLYTLYPPFINAAYRLKQRYNNLHVCLIQTDPVPGRSDVFKKNSRYNKKKGDRLIRKTKVFDSFVVLTKYLADSLEVGDRPFTVVDCIIDESNTDEQARAPKRTGKNRFLYTGSTRDTNGIKTLVDAFRYLPEAELWICGRGNSDEYIRNAEKEMNNIRFFGFVDHRKIKDIQAQCDYMINPRRPTGGFTKYSFPSKTAEYLMTGIPTIMYPLEGMSQEYDDILTFIHSDNPEGLSKELRCVIDSDYKVLSKRAEKAKRYMEYEKNPEKQAERMLGIMRGDNRS